jgi:urocanate hydratase
LIIFRWVCASGKPEDLQKQIPLPLEEMAKTAPIEIQQQMQDNIQWIKGAQENKLVVGSQARIFMPMQKAV